MRLSEIKKKYRDDWMLIEYSKISTNLQVKEGKAVAWDSSPHAALSQSIVAMRKKLELNSEAEPGRRSRQGFSSRPA